MDYRRILVVLAIAVSFAGCASFLSYRIQANQGSFSLEAVPALLQQQSQEVRRTETELRQLSSSHTQLARENERLARQANELAAEHERVVRQLDTLRHELRQLYTTVAESRSLQVPKEWHQQMIENNARHYGAIRDLLASLSEEEFPTLRTWYGEAWRELVVPFQTGRFPTKPDRDRLVQLLGEIREAEQRRAAALGQSLTGASAATSSPALCLGPRWEQLDSDLRQLRYAD